MRPGRAMRRSHDPSAFLSARSSPFTPAAPLLQSPCKSTSANNAGYRSNKKAKLTRDCSAVTNAALYGGIITSLSRAAPNIRWSVLLAAVPFWPLPKHRNTAATPAISMTGSERTTRMDDSFFQSLLAYKSAMAQAKVLLQRGIITQREYGHFDTMMAHKYGLSSGSIFREK